MIRLKRLIHDNTSRWVWQSNIYPTIYESTQLELTNYSEWYPTWSSLTPGNIMINALFRGIIFSSIVGWPSIEIYPGPHHVWVPKYTVCTMLYIGFKIKNEIGFKRNGKWRMFNAFNIVCSLNDHASSFRSSHISAVHLLLERGCEETDQSVTWVESNGAEASNDLRARSRYPQSFRSSIHLVVLSILGSLQATLLVKTKRRRRNRCVTETLRFWPN